MTRTTLPGLSSRPRSPPAHEGTGDLRVAAAAALVSLSLLLPPAAAGYGPMPPRWHAPAWWLAQAMCVHSHEGAWNDPWAPYEGGMQFLRSTWQSVGGTVDPSGHWASVAPPREQLYRAWLVYLRDGHSWREWGTAYLCHLR